MKLKKTFIGLAVFAPLAVLCSAPAAAAVLANTASVYLHSDNGRGTSSNAGDTLWTHGIDGVFSISNTFNGTEVLYTGDQSQSDFDFAAKEYDPVTNTVAPRPLTVGYYDHATRWPFNSPTRPGLDISIANDGANRSIGWFNVLDIGYDSSGNVDRLAVDFRVYQETTVQSGPSIYGSLRFNSDLVLDGFNGQPLPVPEPETYALMLVGLGFISKIARARNKKA